MELVVGSRCAPISAIRTSPSTAASLGWDVASARAAHEARLVHRDVKPENVMIRFDGAVKVLDFGIARSVSPVDTLSSTEGIASPRFTPSPPPPRMRSFASTASAPGIAGTLYYMAPQQLRREPIDGRANRFHGGSSRMSCSPGNRRRPSAKSNRNRLADSLPYAAPSRKDRPAPRGRVARTIMRALAKDPADRFPTMRELLGKPHLLG